MSTLRSDDDETRSQVSTQDSLNDVSTYYNYEFIILSCHGTTPEVLKYFTKSSITFFALLLEFPVRVTCMGSKIPPGLRPS